MDDWYVVIDGKPIGPYTFEELRNVPVKPGTFLKTSDMDDYKEAHELPEIRGLFNFVHSITAPQYFATLDLRLLAVIIDYVLITAVYCFLAVIIVSFSSSQFFRIVVAAAGLVLIPLIKFIYASVMEASAKQGTFGKFWLGIKVSNEEGLPITLSRSVARNAAKWLSVLTLGIGYLTGFFDKRQQCLHDHIAGTMVIKDRLV
ncbi:MAG TPA: RDD family protein [Sphingobacteriaceae bacterium]|nr:RDD family protein [Sphingobacteriaceae bacterium]